ncbi:CHASE domain-containing protein [Aurantiacibacter suaedae]|uniref:CHASE domain-containing protein n=1 Tax=Aurantiacibacter suaedae TaxID=2545755 RepID=UPI001F4FD291|nr:CHASE domain-containing protein [Aurantiacibacter suaedae]
MKYQQQVRRKGAKRWLVQFPRALPVGIFLLITAIAVVSAFAIERGEAQRAETQLSARTDAIASALERRANASSAYLRAGAALLSTLGDIPEGEFRRFVSELRLDSDFRGNDGIGWAEVVRPGEEEAFDALMERDYGEPHPLHPRPDGSQPFAVPVTYLHPQNERARRALGFDMYSEPIRRSAMIEAAVSATPTASDAVVLQQDAGEDVPGFLIYMPVYAPAPGGRALKGYIYSPFNADQFLIAALELEEAGQFGVQLFDGDRTNPGTLMASTIAQEAPGARLSRREVTIANNTWLLVVSRSDGGLLSGLALATLIFGLLVASLLAVVVRLLTQQAEEDEATLAWYGEQASIRNSLTRELNHRVKNTLANVLSIISLTRRRSEDLDSFADSLTGRIRALSATHDLLTQSDWGSTPVGAVIEAELLPYATSGDHTLIIKGEAVNLAPNEALSLGLAVHELATNAAKYGALSVPDGNLRVTWELVSEELVRIEWLERGGPPVRQDRGRGFGTDLIQRIVAHELSNPVDLSFEPEGVRCVLCVPIRRPREFALRAGVLTRKGRRGRKGRIASRVEAQGE